MCDVEELGRLSSAPGQVMILPLATRVTLGKSLIRFLSLQLSHLQNGKGPGTEP